MCPKHLLLLQILKITVRRVPHLSVPIHGNCWYYAWYQISECSSAPDRYLRGFFDTDGSPQGGLQKGCSVRLSQADVSKLEAAQRMLHRLGIEAVIYRDRRLPRKNLLPDGRGDEKYYDTKGWHELVIANSDIMTFRRTINFENPDKARRLANLTENRKRNFNRSKRVAAITEVQQQSDVEMFATTIPATEVLCADGLIYGSSISADPLWLP